MTILAASQTVAPWTWILLGVLASVGLLAMASPQRFKQLAIRGSNWVDSNKYLAMLDKRVDIDQHVLPFSRVLGFAVFSSAIILGVLISR